MSFRPPVLFPPLLFEDEDLVALESLDNFRFYGGGGEDRRSDENLTVILDQKHLIEDDFLAFYGFKLFDIKEIAFLDAILFSACLDHCVHMSTLNLEIKIGA